MAEPGPGGSATATPKPAARSVGVRRAASQAGLVAALLAVFTVCATAAGTCSLLLTAGNERALSAAVVQADGSEATGSPDVTRVMVHSATITADGAVPPDAATLLPLTRRVLLDATKPYSAVVSLWTSTPMLFLAGKDVRCGYLLDADTMPANAALRSGTWPAGPAPAGGPIPVAIPGTTAAALGASLGSELRLSKDRHNGDPVAPFFDVVVTGIFDPSGSPTWSRDTLRGQGYDPDYLRLPTFGPFVVAPGTLEALAAPVERVAAVIDPDLAGDASGIPGLLARLQAVPSHIEDVAGSTVDPVQVSVPLGPAFDGMRAELSLSNSLVLAVFVIVASLGLATASLVARVLVGRRAAEATLLRDRGAASAQLIRGACVEAAAVAALAALLAVPLALTAYRLTAPAGVHPESWPGVGSGTGFWFAIALVAGAVLPAAVVVIAAFPERSRRGRQVISGPLARSGIDVMLALVATLTYVQLRSHVVSSATVDPLLVVGPAACAVALAALVTRIVPFVARAANAAARRSRGVVVPLAGWHLARGGAAQGVFLLVLTTAVATLGLTFLGTWSLSQDDQAAAEVGADLVVGQAGGMGTARELAAATGGTVTPVADSAVVLGSRPDGVRVVALDSTLADKMLRGRLPNDATWSSAMSGLAPEGGGTPLTLPGGRFQLTLTGGRPASSPESGTVAPVLTATPTLVLVDEAGYQTTVVGTATALDGRSHAARLPTASQPELPAGRWRVVAIDLLLGDHSGGDLSSWGTSSATAKVSISIQGASSAGGSWDSTADPGRGAVQPGDASVRAGTVDASFSYGVLELSWQDAHLTLLSFPASTQVPVVMTEDLRNELGLNAGDRMKLTWGTTSVEVVLVRTVPYVPSHVREAALLADLSSLERALLSAGGVDSVTDVWWASAPRTGAAEALRAAGRIPVVTSAETTTELRDGPLRAPLRMAWTLAIAAAVGLALTGTAAHAAAQAQRRAATIARVRAIGVSRRDALSSHLLQHAAVTAMAVALGAFSGAVLAWLLAPLLVISPQGLRAIPPPELVWSPAPTAAVVGAILVGGFLAGLPAALAMVRRSTVEALRAGEAP